MPITVTVGPYDETGFIATGSLSAQRALGGRTTCNFRVAPNDDAWVPIVGEPIVIARDGSNLFAGFVWSVNSRRLKTGDVVTIEADVTCVDNAYIADRRVAGERQWASVSSSQIVADIITNDLAAEDIGGDYVATGPTIEKFEIAGYPTVTEALNALAEVASMRWYIDEGKQLRWFADGDAGYDAPFSITAANVTEISKTSSLEEYGNQIILRLPSYLRDSETQTFDNTDPNYPPDSSRQSFALLYPVASAPSITVDGAAATVGIQGVDTGKDWYWSQGSNWITQDSGATPLTSSQVLAVTYVGSDAITVEASNTDEYTARAAIEGGSGKHTRVFDQAKMLTRAQADESAAAMLDLYGELPTSIEYTTSTYHESSADLLRPGMQQSVNVDGIDAASAEYIVRSVKFQDGDRWPDHIWVVVELVRGPLLKDMPGLLKELSGGQSPSVSAGSASSLVGSISHA